MSFGVGGGASALELGEALPKSAVQLREVIMVNPAQLEPAYRVREGQHEFKVCWQAENKKGISYIQPLAEDFVTPEGVRVGTSYREVKRVTVQDVRKYPGYLFTVLFPSGWYAGFVQGHDMTEGELQEATKVIVIFKSAWLW